MPAISGALASAYADLQARVTAMLAFDPAPIDFHAQLQIAVQMQANLQTAIDIEKTVRGATAGYNTPTFICDAPGGGGKRDVHSFEHYDRDTGVSVWTAPSVKSGKYFLYFDPIDTLAPDIQARWKIPAVRP